MEGLKYLDIAKPINFVPDNAQRSNEELKGTNSLFAVEYEYHNGLSRPVTVITRLGIKAEIPPSQNTVNRDFLIRVKLHLGINVKLNVDSLLSSSQESSRLFAQVITEGTSRYIQGQRRYTLDYSVNLEDIEGRGGNIYLNNFDIVLTTMDSYLQAKHPFGEEGLRNYSINDEVSINNVDSFGYTLKIIDSLGSFGERFVNIAGNVYRVPVSKSHELEDGVYITSSGSVQGDYALVKPIFKRYSFKEAEQTLRLYRTVNEARTLGDEMASKERELKELTLSLKEKENKLKEERLDREHEFEVKKHELKDLELESERRKKDIEARHTEKLTRLKEEIADLEHARNISIMKQKDYYESRSQERKDTSEVVKFLPAIITGFFGLVMLISKLQSGQSK